MVQNFRATLSSFALLAIVTGIFYPLMTLGVGQLAFHDKANGSLITIKNTEGNNVVIGARIIGQHFADDKYFHGRPSAARDGSGTPPDDISYNPLYSGASNLGPLSGDLVSAVKTRAVAIKGNDAVMTIPVDMVTSSASGLDPHISVANAHLQVARVAEARGLGAAQIEGMIAANTEDRTFGILGEPRVNVLGLNRALDQFSAAQPTNEDFE
jgi:K+-transporting ATPase ATPase C chain